ncbi:MAG: thioredoxin family protein [Bacteroidetes bacterium]|nr:thioredoxin family protein [Bacteroidota bacterium]MDA0860638.1 thioredoxin family protein [Bacteroidota bacterium]MDA1319210.1 thioredoxin family protein [Bacteroidota bacterium]
MKYLALIFGFVSLLSFGQNWETSFSKAKDLASQQNKPIVLVFQGSDWCAPCIKMDREIWSTEIFKTYASKHYIMLKADFPRRKNNKLSESQTKANAELAEKYNNQGFFPFVVMLDKEGNVLGQRGYSKITPSQFINDLNSMTNLN